MRVSDEYFVKDVARFSDLLVSFGSLLRQIDQYAGKLIKGKVYFYFKFTGLIPLC